MRIGSEDRTKVWTMVGVLSLALIAIIWNFSGGGTSPVRAPGSAAVESTGAPTVKVPRHSRLRPKATLDPTVRLAMLERSENEEYRGRGRDIFALPAPAGLAIPKPIKNPLLPKPPITPYVPQPDPGPPPINLKFYGFASKSGQPKKIFLSAGDDIFIGAEGDIINRRYKILHIGTTSVDVEDVLTNNKQSLPLIQS